ncbi:MAG: UvrD-helicase domain-containing protein [Clostridium sp.]|nr:UvrD-helicase domain-containing protein [Clostridium sp.]
MLNLNLLNKEQREAVETVDGPLLVLAGAGSGKTRVLTYRIANLIENHGVAPWSILALTFTNKAAKEMKERTDKLIGIEESDMWVTTFHSFCVRVLRIDIDRLGYDSRFVIYDEQDQNGIIKDIVSPQIFDEKRMSNGLVRSMISQAKNSGESPERFLLDSGTGMDDKLVEIYRAYQKKLKSSNALDFDDLLIKTVELFETCPDVLEKYRKKFRFVLVDEYQDTNAPQYRIIKLICGEHRNICVVGDDDQSIYGWRGADIRNILDFEKDFPGAKVIRLEQNYRSTKAILDCANRVITHNMGRKSKKLWTAKVGGSPVEFLSVQNERDEAYNIAKTIIDLRRREDRKFNDFAILYRTHAQSRVLESVLVSGFGIPISVIGGTRFYARREIKDLLSYLRLIANPSDDGALKRIINVPKRSIGEATVSAIESLSESMDQSMLITILTPGILPEKISKKVSRFADLMRDLFAKRYELSLEMLTEYIIDAIGYAQYIVEQGDDNLETRQENIEELLGAMREHEEQITPGSDALQSFLELTALNSDADNIDESDGTVKLMTLHSAKGLEFPVVFMPGMEDDIFPSRRSKEDETGIEEERRLCYVGVTRAKERLYLYAAEQRALYGQTQHNDPSIFLEEMGFISEDTPMKRNSFGSAGRDSYGWGSSFGRGSSYGYERSGISDKPRSDGVSIDPDVTAVIRKLNGLDRSSDTSRTSPRQASPSGSGHSAATKASAAKRSYKTQQRIRHPQFGEGTIIDISDAGSTVILSIDFDSVGVKRIAAGYVNLEIIE